MSMDEICTFDVRDTQSKGTGRLPYAALVRAILISAGPEVTDSFNPCSLRYHLTLSEGKVISVKPKISHREGSEGYYDDDYATGPHRLGGTSTQGGTKRKDLFEKLLEQWFSFAVLGLEGSEDGVTDLRKTFRKKRQKFDIDKPEGNPKTRSQLGMINEALSALVPEEIRKHSNKLSMKVDVYTNRTLLGWHKDGNDEHALILGLLNISNGPIGSTELFFDPNTNAPAELAWIEQHLLRPASVRRKAMLDRIKDLKDVANTEQRFHPFEKQEVGEIRWFNDAVWVHRTPPLNRFDDAYREKVFVNGCDFTVPQKIKDLTSDRTKYENVDHLVPQGRMLVRITIRDMYEPCAEVWFGDRAIQGDSRVFFRSPGMVKAKWAYIAGPYYLDFDTDHYETEREQPWCLQTCDPAKFAKYKKTKLTFAYQYPDSYEWNIVTQVEVPGDEG